MKVENSPEIDPSLYHGVLLRFVPAMEVSESEVSSAPCWLPSP